MQTLMLRSPLVNPNQLPSSKFLNPVKVFQPLQKHLPATKSSTGSNFVKRIHRHTKYSHRNYEISTISESLSEQEVRTGLETESSKYIMLGAVSVGVLMILMGFDDGQKALALGPEGPLVEEFWDNVRRYGLYALTVSTGALWALLEPIYELLKNPISAVLVVIILGGGFFIVTQVINAMIGASDFSYQYYY